MNRWLALLLACVALSVVVAGCGGDDEESGGDAQTTEQPADEGGGGGGDAGSGAGKEVSLKEIKFNPASVTVKAGQTRSPGRTTTRSATT